MPKKYFISNTLIIVESPAKCKKIEEFLGSGYTCMASYGHLRELNTLQDIDHENGFSIKYTIIDDDIKKRQIKILQKAIHSASEVILATDNDREGEAIAWHICDLFQLDIEKTKRILFHEITDTAIQYAIKHPSKINMNIVYAQQTRQILDILVGFKISPILWKYISNYSKTSLSAGRCQTPALRLVSYNEKELQTQP